MAESVVDAIAGIRKIPNLEKKKEKELISEVILRVIQALGWNTFDKREVGQEVSAGDSADKVDVVLNPGKENSIFVEVKNAKVNLDHSNSEKQLINYCQSDPSVKLAVLTNGKIWCFYLPKHNAPPGPHGGINWRGKRFARVDIMDGPPKNAKNKAKELERFLASSLDFSEMLENAEQEIQKKESSHKAEEELVRVWNEKVATRKPTPHVINALVDILSEEEGFVPDKKDVADFLSTRQNQFLTSLTTSPDAKKKPGRPKVAKG